MNIFETIWFYLSNILIASGLLVFIITMFMTVFLWFLKRRNAKEYLAFDIFKNRKVCEQIIAECNKIINGKKRIYSEFVFTYNCINTIFSSDIVLSLFGGNYYLQFNEYIIALKNIDNAQKEFLRITTPMTEEVLYPTDITFGFLEGIKKRCELLIKVHYDSNIFKDITNDYKNKYDKLYVLFQKGEA